MHERDSNMISTEIYYSPKYWWSLGLADIHMKSDDQQRKMDANFAQENFLVKRWNMPNAQANPFASAGYGTARSQENTLIVSPNLPDVLHKLKIQQRLQNIISQRPPIKPNIKL